jgi:hypothetical protein
MRGQTAASEKAFLLFSLGLDCRPEFLSIYPSLGELDMCQGL